mgnify:CR=1 FL=1
MRFREKFFLSCTGMIFLLVLALIVFSKNGLLDYTRLEKEKAAVLRENAKIQSRNQSLLREIRRLKRDPDYIRHVARHDMGMSAENEVIFKVMEHGIPKNRE